MHRTPNSLKSRWIDLNGLDRSRRWPLAVALMSFIIYFAAVVLGSIVQPVIPLGWHMGWMQQAVSAIAILVLASLLGERNALLALRRPPNKAWIWATLIGLSIAAMGALASQLLLKPEHALVDTEYLIYQATMPGLGEELGLRGLWLSLLLVGFAKWQKLDVPAWAVLVMAAVPFAALHVLERAGRDLWLVASFTLYAGVVLGWLRASTASIWPAVLAHNIANLVSALLDS
jgi:membrane protease YdiL (CAAX protease family)